MASAKQAERQKLKLELPEKIQGVGTREATQASHGVQPGAPVPSCSSALPHIPHMFVRVPWVHFQNKKQKGSCL